jgi:hypothetical protein
MAIFICYVELPYIYIIGILEAILFTLLQDCNNYFLPCLFFSEIHSHHLCFGMIDLVVQHRTATGQYIHGLLVIARTIVGHIKMGTMSMRHKVLPHSLPSWLITFYN